MRKISTSLLIPRLILSNVAGKKTEKVDPSKNLVLLHRGNDGEDVSSEHIISFTSAILNPHAVISRVRRRPVDTFTIAHELGQRSLATKQKTEILARSAEL